MSKTILVGLDPQRADHASAHFGIAMARFAGAPLVVAAVQRSDAPIAPLSHRVQHDELMTDWRPVLEQLEPELRDAGVPFECVVVEATSAARGLHTAAEDRDAGMLVVGAAARSGSTVANLLHGAPCPVTVVRGVWGAERSFSAIGAAFVDTPDGREALRGAHTLARRAGARLLIITVVPDEFIDPHTRRETEDEVLAAAGELGLDVTADEIAVLAGNDPAERIVLETNDLDLLVCGSRGYGPLRAALAATGG